ncbi:oncostatin-M-specific receptor subunit beta-like protein [Willisornis vidua]|uniref:Oncostatin-M-specific receptor subunit beta-like protein n=1 Tax=Willisornis vidua TaxID=1566151 RepID=A0ABQ9CPR2_9PASS|nr:oncostatin-M-specific receptor subunit beta-like protein [Willisornis vidua]
MNHFIVLTVLLPLRTCYTTYSQQDSAVFPVTYLNVSRDLALQRLLVEWDVAKSAHDAKLAMSFEIQVSQTDDTNKTVWTDMRIVTCTWSQGGDTYLYEKYSPKYTLSDNSIRETGHVERNYTSSGGKECDLVLEGTEELKEEQVNGTDDGIFISWEPRCTYDSYIIDWCNFPKLQPCDLQWKRFGPNISSAVINSAVFVPGERYNFYIYGSVANRASLLEKKTGYLRELPPLHDPIVDKIELTFNTVTLSWDSYLTNESQSGFVKGYHIYVSPVQENCTLKGSKKHILSGDSELCKYTIENPEEKRYTVEHLMPNTKYKLVVKAYTGGGETPILNFLYIDTPYNSTVLYFLFLLVIVPTLVAAMCHWKKKWVKECCCPAIPSPHKSKVLSFKEFKISSEKVLKISDCIPDVLAVDNKAEAQKLHSWSQLSSTPTEDKTDGHDSSWIYPEKNVERGFPPIPTPQTHNWFENFAYFSHLEVESDPYQIPERLEASKPELAVVLYQPHCYIDIFNEDPASTNRETAGRKSSLRYISQTDVHCLGKRL